MCSYCRFCFRRIQTYSSIIQEHTHAYSEPCVSLAYPEPWHNLITKHVQTPRYIHNTILNIFTKAPSWTFDKVLNAPLSLKDAILYGVFNIIFQIYSGILKIYSAIFIIVKAYYEPQYMKEHSAAEILRHILNATHNIQADSMLFRAPAYLGTLCFSQTY